LFFSSKLTQPRSVKVLAAILHSIFLSLGLPANAEVEPVKTVPHVATETPFAKSTFIGPFAVATFAAKPAPIAPLVRRARPISMAVNPQSLRVLKPNGRWVNFLSEPAILNNRRLSADRADPRLLRVGARWALSNAFHASVGADPWAMPGVGFPNIETHGPIVRTGYKPYRAIVDWKRDAAAGDWKPVPAVYCMGLTSQQIADRASEHEQQIQSYSREHGISASLIKAVITKESCFDTKAISKVGAEGLMQLMPETARWLNVTDRNDVNQNLSAGIRYLADLRKRFGTDELALAAYNAGPGNVERHGGIPPFKETQQYVRSVLEIYRLYSAASRFKNQRESY